MTAQGSARTRFRRAIEGRWIFHAELAARELGQLTLGEALDLVLLYAEAEASAKFERAAIRWHSRYTAESQPSLLDAQIALTALMALRTSPDAAERVLLGLVEQLAGTLSPV